MLRTVFTPRRDGLSDWDLPRYEGLPNWLIKPLFADAHAKALEALHRGFFDAVEIYDLSRHIRRWIDQAALSVCAQEAGKFFLSLDYHHACLPLPRQMRRLRGKKATLFNRYFDQRSLDNLGANLANLLQALAILSLIPDAWFPQKALEDRIEDKIRQLGVYRQVRVDCDLSLPPGGMRWMACTTLHTVAQVRAKLVRGQPCLVRLLRSLEGLENNRQAIVYACRELPGGAQRLEVFEPDCVLEEHALQVSPNGDAIEIAPPSRPLPVLGLLCEAYSSVTPPRECIPWWLRLPASRWIWRKL
jgi:hypothetical protein